MTSPTQELACELIRRQSVTPDDAGCLDIIGARLQALGFQRHSLPFADVSNLWAVRGEDGPLFVFAGHTDVVPTGPVAQWQSPPFEPSFRNGCLYGRGAADMKGSLAAMVTACEAFFAKHSRHHGRIGFLLTSDEEGPAKNGTVKVMEWLAQQQIQIDWCIVGEPSSSEKLGDTIKNGRRGSLNFELTVNGRQGHIAYPHLADNPIHRLAPALADLCRQQWDAGNEHFPATSLQLSNINGGTGATNVIPGAVTVVGNFRFSTEVCNAELQRRTEAILGNHELNYTINWQLSGQPFLTPKGELVNALREAVKEETGFAPELSTAGGTSDGRFIAPSGAQVAELGPVNATIHQIDECVLAEDLDTLARIYRRCLEQLLG